MPPVSTTRWPNFAGENKTGCTDQPAPWAPLRKQRATPVREGNCKVKCHSRVLFPLVSVSLWNRSIGSLKMYEHMA